MNTGLNRCIKGARFLPQSTTEYYINNSMAGGTHLSHTLMTAMSMSRLCHINSITGSTQLSDILSKNTPIHTRIELPVYCHALR